MVRTEFRGLLEQDSDNLYILTDSQGRILSHIEIDETEREYTYTDIVRLLRMPYIKYTYRICVLNPDDTIFYEIPVSDIVQDSISYDETLQNGLRRTLSLRLINKNGKYTPSANTQRGYYSVFYDYVDKNKKKYVSNPKYLQTPIWGMVRMSFDIGLRIEDEKYMWFKKGKYIITKMSASQQDSNKEVSIDLKDKFYLFEGNIGKLVTPVEIPVGSDCLMLVKDILSQDMGNGYSYDLLPPIFDSSLVGLKTSVTIKKEAGDTQSSVLQDIAEQMSASYFYNECGNLIFIPINEELKDMYKPITWYYETKFLDLLDVSIDYDIDNAVNMIKVIGDNMGETVNYALAVNKDPRSPICVGFLGKRLGDIITNENTWSDSMAFDLARYYLRKKSISCLNIKVQAKLNPLINVDKLISIDHEFFNFTNKKLIVSGISFSSGEANMNINTTDIQTLDFLHAGDEGYEY